MIKTWNERCEKHRDHQTGMVSHGMIQMRMQEEIDELRAALLQPERKPLTVDQISEIACPDHLKFARRIEKAHGIGGEHE